MRGTGRSVKQHLRQGVLEMGGHSFWADARKGHQQRMQLEGTKKTDVTIIGAGFTGLSSALFLQEKGCQTTVVEQGTVGSGASGRNGSLMLVGYKHSLVNIAKRLGVETAKDMLEISLNGIDLVKDVSEKYHIDCELENNGSFFAAYKPGHFENLKREQEFMHEKLNYKNYIVEKQNLRDELDSQLYYGGLIDPNSYHFHPLKYALGLANAVEKKGGNIFEGSHVLSVKKKQGQFHIYTEKGEIISEELIIATNGYTTDLNKGMYKKIIPMNSNMLATEPLDSAIAQKIIPNRRGVFDTKNLLYYFRLSSDNRLLFGSRLPGKVDDRLYERLREKMTGVFPQLKDHKIDYKWGGKLAVSMNMFPHVGVNKDGSHYALGYSGHGVSLSTLMGKIVAANITEERTEKSSLEKLACKKIPFHHQKELIVGLATRFFKLKDVIS
jgi:gamma-glutamylputrescine oxidase